MIEFNNLTKIYGSKFSLSIPRLVISEREFIGLVGNNGAGKTTLLSLALDLIQPTTGSVKSKDQPVSQTEEWKSYTGSYLNESFLIPFLTPLEFLGFIGRLHGKNSSDIDDFLTRDSGFYKENISSRKYLRELSAGNKNKIGIMAAMFWNPEILILDEPFSNLDPGSRSWLKAKLKNLHEEGMTIVVSSHDLNHITEICGRVILLEDGKIIRDTATNQETLQELENYFSVQVHTGF
jgi:ABC-2 type transport system ATP-binding protein